MSPDRATAHVEVARFVIDAVNACQEANDALVVALDAGAQRGVPVPGWQHLMNARSALLPVLDPHGPAVQLAEAELRAAEQRRTTT